MYVKLLFHCSQVFVFGVKQHEAVSPLFPLQLFSILRYTILTLRLPMSYIYGAPSKARNANVVYIWTYVWQR